MNVVAASFGWFRAALLTVIVGAALAIVVGPSVYAADSSYRYDSNPTATTHTADTQVDHPRGERSPGGGSWASTSRIGRGLAAKAGSSAEKVVIGEDMAGRVIPAAKRLGAKYYDPPYLPPAERMAHNRAWINERMDRGCRIIDCGAAPGRANYPNPTSRYYQMERGEIARRNYPGYEPPSGGH